MKLKARKSIAALGTALALSLTPVAVPSMAPVALAEVTKSQYNDRWGQVKANLGTVRTLIASATTSINKTAKIVSGNSDASLKVDNARTQLSIAEALLTNAQQSFDSAPKDQSNEGNYGTLASANTNLADAKTALSKVSTNLTEARNAIFVCPNADNESKDNNSDDSGSSGSSTDSFTSSGNHITWKNGKQVCVSKREYWTDMLTKVVAVLGTVFTLITTVTKISDVVMKNNPLAPKA